MNRTRRKSMKLVPLAGEYYWVNTTIPNDPSLSELTFSLVGMYFQNPKKECFWRIEGQIRPADESVTPVKHIPRPRKRIM